MVICAQISWIWSKNMRIYDSLRFDISLRGFGLWVTEEANSLFANICGMHRDTSIRVSNTDKIVFHCMLIAYCYSMHALHAYPKHMDKTKRQHTILSNVDPPYVTRSAWMTSCGLPCSFPMHCTCAADSSDHVTSRHVTSRPFPSLPPSLPPLVPPSPPPVSQRPSPVKPFEPRSSLERLKTEGCRKCHPLHDSSRGQNSEGAGN